MRASRRHLQSRCVFLINCGANLNLQEFLSLDEYEGLVLGVVDSHRPLDLNNIQEQDEDANFEVWTPSFVSRPARPRVFFCKLTLNCACARSCMSLTPATRWKKPADRTSACSKR